VGGQEEIDGGEEEDKVQDMEEEEDSMVSGMTEGTVVWAKIAGDPWWPAVLFPNWKSGTHFICFTGTEIQILVLQVVFLEWNQSRNSIYFLYWYKRYKSTNTDAVDGALGDTTALKNVKSNSAYFLNWYKSTNSEAARRLILFFY